MVINFSFMIPSGLASEPQDPGKGTSFSRTSIQAECSLILYTDSIEDRAYKQVRLAGLFSQVADLKNARPAKHGYVRLVPVQVPTKDYLNPNQVHNETAQA